MLISDFNAKIGANNTCIEQVMGRESLGTINDNKERLFDFCTRQNIVIRGTKPGYHQMKELRTKSTTYASVKN